MEAMMRVLQGNMHRSRVTHDLLPKLCHKLSTDVVIISEQYRGRDEPGWFSDETRTAAIWISDTRYFGIAGHGSGHGFVWVRSGSITYVRCYFIPSKHVQDFQTRFDGLEEAVGNMKGDLVVAGDFNSKVIEWDIDQPDYRRVRLMNAVSRLGLVVLNTGHASTFRRPGCRETIIDISLATESLAVRISGWRVIEDYTASNHQYITFRVGDEKQYAGASGQPKWNLKKLDAEKFSRALELGQFAFNGI